MASETNAPSGGHDLQHRAEALLHAAPNTGLRSHGRIPTSRKDAERLTSQLERFLGRGPLSGMLLLWDTTLAVFIRWLLPIAQC